MRSGRERRAPDTPRFSARPDYGTFQLVVLDGVPCGGLVCVQGANANAALASALALLPSLCTISTHFSPRAWVQARNPTFHGAIVLDGVLHLGVGGYSGSIASAYGFSMGGNYSNSSRGLMRGRAVFALPSLVHHTTSTDLLLDCSNAEWVTERGWNDSKFLASPPPSRVADTVGSRAEHPYFIVFLCSACIWFALHSYRCCVHYCCTAFAQD